MRLNQNQAEHAIIVLALALLPVFTHTHTTHTTQRGRERGREGGREGGQGTYQSVNSALNQNQAELAVLVLAVTLQVLTHGHGLLDQHVQVLRDLGGQEILLQQTQDLGAGHRLDLGNAVRVPENHTDVRGGQPLLRQLAHMLLHVLGGGLGPGGGSALVRDGGRGHALAGAVHATHLWRGGGGREGVISQGEYEKTVTTTRRDRDG